ncbi:hypothetical protein AQI96_34785 [Streptomyces canus]|nr:hypothetical protein AQI96_34785 [Streptomyces canus]
MKPWSAQAFRTPGCPRLPVRHRLHLRVPVAPPSVGAANGFQIYYSSGSGVRAFGRHNDDTTSTAFTVA